MIRVEIKLWPRGDRSKEKTLGAINIANEGTGSPTKGNYKAALFGKGGRRLKVVKVEGFPRRRLLAHDLLLRVLRAAYGDRNGEG